MDDVRWSLAVATAPAQEPVTREQAKEYIREDGDDQDDVIDSMVAAARTQQEQALGVAMLTQTLAMRLDEFPAAIELPRWPVLGVSSIAYVDTNGATQTLSASLYQVDIYSRPARIEPSYGNTWPSTRAQLNAVTVTFTAGFGDEPDEVPATLRSALLFRVADLYENREAKIVGTIVAENATVGAMEAPYKLHTF